MWPSGPEPCFPLLYQGYSLGHMPFYHVAHPIMSTFTPNCCKNFTGDASDERCQTTSHCCHPTQSGDASDVRQPPTAVTRHSPAGSETLRFACSALLAPTCGVRDAPPDLLRPAGSRRSALLALLAPTCGVSTLRRTRSACSAAKEPHLTTRSAPTPLKTSGVPIPALTPSGVSPCSAGQ